jgi:hypothetical protein
MKTCRSEEKSNKTELTLGQAMGCGLGGGRSCRT